VKKIFFSEEKTQKTFGSLSQFCASRWQYAKGAKDRDLLLERLIDSLAQKRVLFLRRVRAQVLEPALRCSFILPV
jgi:hypothetical protein